MSLKIYNSLSGKKEEFIPLQEGKVKMYVCGVTVYDRGHIGHARAAVVFDVIFRFFRHLGYEATYVRNYTDVDDKIINRANREGVSSKVIAERYIQEYEQDMQALGMERPTHEPRATENIPQIISLVKKLVDKEFAYVIDGDVYFSVEKFPPYGKLSGRDPEEMRAGARVEVDERKKSPLDFALWKSSKPGEPEWDSPWGKGRPGWHIECSAMSQRFLGETFDIHGGGKDLIFPHHENEIAQSEAATGKPFVRYWVHNGFVNINHEKMSKSLGNILAIRDLLQDYHPEALRLFLLSNHYRSPLDFSLQNIVEAGASLDRFYSALLGIGAFLSGLKEIRPLNPAGLKGIAREVFQKSASVKEDFLEAMKDDFNSALALGYLHDLTRMLNRVLGDKGFRKDPAAPALLGMGRDCLLENGRILGLFRREAAEYFIAQRKRFLQIKGLKEEEILNLIARRETARQEKDWSRADEVRTQAATMGIVFEDGPEGTTWRPA
ncbi:MAG TPA: cysteine--tRNA ligase [Thermodesulfobacteriota bacterium]|nr:cysteine--tRNA ligase [Thermodesulfobacteriota bacterium]